MFKFITFFAEDLEKTADVYRAIGLTFVGEKHGEGPFHLAHEGNGLVIEIYRKSAANCDGMMLGFEVADLSKARSAILATTGTIVKDIARVDGADRMIIADPEGRKLYVSESTGNTVETNG